MLFYDQRSRGRSDTITDPTRIGIDQEVRDLETVRRHFGLTRFALIGWSYLGGVITLYAAGHLRRVERLCLMCSIAPRWPGRAAYYGQKPREELDARIDPAAVRHLEALRDSGLPERDPEAFCREHRRVYRVRQTGNPAALVRMRSEPCVCPNEWPDNLAQWQQRVLAPIPADYDWRPHARTITAPTLVVHGTEDPIPLGASHEWAATFGDARLLVLAGSGHYPHLERPDLFYPALDQFLAGTWPPGAAPPSALPAQSAPARLGVGDLHGKQTMDNQTPASGYDRIGGANQRAPWARCVARRRLVR
jgi:pimeloyl-ACP methyl ester carboxylesterase